MASHLYSGGANYQFCLQESPIFQLQVTFAAMQHSALNTFNPVKLVESLKLRATEQQDAQEYVASQNTMGRAT